MDIALWIIAGILAGAFFMAGMMKVVTPKEKLVPKMGWAEDFKPAQIKLIGIVEVAAAVGLILPPLLDIAPDLAILAAAGLVLTMIGAFSTHVRRKDPQSMKIANLVLGALALCVVIGRYWVEPF